MVAPSSIVAPLTGPRQDDVNFETNKFDRKLRKPPALSLGVPVLERDILFPFYVAELAQALLNCHECIGRDPDCPLDTLSAGFSSALLGLGYRSKSKQHHCNKD